MAGVPLRLGRSPGPSCKAAAFVRRPASPLPPWVAAGDLASAWLTGGSRESRGGCSLSVAAGGTPVPRGSRQGPGLPDPAPLPGFTTWLPLASRRSAAARASWLTQSRCPRVPGGRKRHWLRACKCVCQLRAWGRSESGRCPSGEDLWIRVRGQARCGTPEGIA